MIRLKYASFLIALGALSLGTLTSCVERKITVGSDPSGAMLLVNDQEMGHTPVTFPFTWYGDYDIRLHYEKNTGTPENPHVTRYYVHTHKETKTPWFEIIGIDLITEILPIEFKDEQVWAFTIPEVQQPTDEDLIKRAKDLKGQLNPPATTRP